MGQDTRTPIDRLVNWWKMREYRERPCQYPACTNLTTLFMSTAAGHRGYCSDDCLNNAREDAI